LGWDLNSVNVVFNLFKSRAFLILGITLAAFGVRVNLFEDREAGAQMDVVFLALAALNFWSAAWVFTNQLAFWFGALGLRAFPVAFWLFTNCLAFRFGGLAMGDTVWGLADIYTFRAVISFTSFIWAHDGAIRSLTLNITNCVFGFLAT